MKRAKRALITGVGITAIMITLPGLAAGRDIGQRVKNRLDQRGNRINYRLHVANNRDFKAWFIGLVRVTCHLIQG